MTGQLTYTEVKNVDLTALREAVTKWGQAPGKFSQVGTNFNTEVAKGLADSNWEGETADAAERRFRKVRAQLTAAAEESRRVHSVLSEGVEQFSQAKGVLDAIEKELEGHKYLRLNKADGSVYLDLPDDEEKHRASMTKSYQEAFAAYRERTRNAITKANEADAALVQALTADVNGTARGFNSGAYNSLGEARKAAAEDLRTVLDLAGIEQGKVTSTQLAQMNAVLARHSQDPLFAEQFATRLGPEKTLQLWYNATHPNNPLYPDTKIDEKAWWKTAKSLQESLGTTLATASHSGSPEMKEWKQEVLRMGPQRVETGGSSNPYGYQIMSNLMRFGKYESGFLTKYSDELTAWDKKNNTEGRPYWGNQADIGVLNLHHGKGEYDTGHDPVTGMLEALGHNPEVATDYFRPDKVNGHLDSDGELNDNFRYLTTERDWFYTGDNGKPIPIGGHEALGHALTAATTGYAWDDEALASGENRRSAATADVMEQVVHTYGGDDGPKLLNEQPAMAEALGAMGGAYVDDLNRDLSGLGETKMGEYFPPGYKGHAEFGREQAVDFLSVLGQNETSHGLMNQAEHLYTLGRFAENPPSEGDENYVTGKGALLAEAEARGILDASRMRAIEAQYGADSAAAQDAYLKSDDWRRVGISAGTPAAQNVLLNIAGKSGPWGVAIPIATGALAEFGKQFGGETLFGGADLPEKPNTEDIFQMGERDLGGTAERHLLNQGSDTDANGTLIRELKNAYLGYGPGASDREGQGPHTG
ncbi:hypothetical protein LHJ74_30250 [Streptomyces sp. N2-109]|uniref:AG2 protein n=1 Tax=Streptomyces gossypii TaxID=2883101 RepID=A0ABT2K1V5_9ACTN|nr:hypothetical protein [Streptomyces gossypii]MCT2594141.1 hypothetical protein [Streptomyces gossypii]